MTSVRWKECIWEVIRILFHEIYGSYFNVVSEVLKEACSNNLTYKRLHEIVRNKGFGESALGIPTALIGGEWSLLTSDLKTPVKHPPSMPLTLLQKRWLKALMNDPRIKLFGVSVEGLEEIRPLYSQDTIHYFDRYLDGDPFGEKNYISHFRCVLTAIKEKQILEVCFIGGHGLHIRRICFPWHLEYSSKDDKFRLIATAGQNTLTINIGRIKTVKAHGRPYKEPLPPKIQMNSLVLELIDERNALERAMLHFSHLEKETTYLNENRYHITLRYDRDDETELLIRVLSFGPMLRVISPDSFISLIRERLVKQKSIEFK